jgi:exodeoxyribonuclease VII large subunit
MRAPTPTGAAELAVPVKAELEATLASLSARLRGCMSRHGERKRQTLRAAARALPSADQLLALPRRRFDEAAARLARGLEVAVERKAARLAQARLSPAVLTRRTGEARRLLSREGEQLPKCARAYLRARRGELREAAARLRIEPVSARIRAGRDRFEAAARRADTSFLHRTERAAAQLSQTVRLIETLSYKSVLARGFAIVESGAGRVLKRAADVSSGDALAIHFSDGRVGAVATGGEAPRPKPRPAPKEPARQGSLF